MPAALLALIQVAATLLPELAQVVPIVENMVNGGTPSDADIATLEAVTATLNAQASAAETAAGATGPTA